MNIYGQFLDSYRFDGNFVIAMNTESFYYNEATDYHMGAGNLLYNGYRCMVYFTFQSSTLATFQVKRYYYTNADSFMMSTHYPGGNQFYVAGLTLDTSLNKFVQVNVFDAFSNPGN